MITIYRIFISTHFIKRVIKAFTWNEKLNYDISDVTNLVSSPYHAANKCLIFCFLGFYLLLYIFIGHFFFFNIPSLSCYIFYPYFLYLSLQSSADLFA